MGFWRNLDAGVAFPGMRLHEQVVVARQQMGVSANALVLGKQVFGIGQITSDPHVGFAAEGKAKVLQGYKKSVVTLQQIGKAFVFFVGPKAQNEDGIWFTKTLDHSL